MLGCISFCWHDWCDFPVSRALIRSFMSNNIREFYISPICSAGVSFSKTQPISFSVPWWNCGRYWSLLILQSWLERSFLLISWPLTLAGPHTWQCQPTDWKISMKTLSDLRCEDNWRYLEHLPWLWIHYFDSKKISSFCKYIHLYIWSQWELGLWWQGREEKRTCKQFAYTAWHCTGSYFA